MPVCPPVQPGDLGDDPRIPVVYGGEYVNTYYLWSREEVEAYLEERRCREEAVRQENEARFPSAGIRERLLARRARQA